MFEKIAGSTSTTVVDLNRKQRQRKGRPETCRIKMGLSSKTTTTVSFLVFSRHFTSSQHHSTRNININLLQAGCISRKGSSQEAAIPLTRLR